MEGEICLQANREFSLSKYTEKTKTLSAIPSAEQLRASLEASRSSEARSVIASLFDQDTFVETAAFTKRSFCDYVASERDLEFEGVITGYGAVEGKLVFAFVQDASRMKGAVDAVHARKIAALYELALRNEAPMIGVFNSNGADIFEGASALAAYGRIMKCVSDAKGVIPQYALVSGPCIGTAAALASMFDFTVAQKDAPYYVHNPALTGVKDAQKAEICFCGTQEESCGYLRRLVSLLPSSSDQGVTAEECTDDLNRMLGNVTFEGDAALAVSVLSDNGNCIACSADTAPSIYTGFTVIGGVLTGVVASASKHDDGKITAEAARKAARFVSFCDSFSIPLLTLVDSKGLAICPGNEKDSFAASLAALAAAYAASTSPRVTVIIGSAIGAAFPLLGSKALGADLVYAVEDAEIAALTAPAGVAFAFDKLIGADTTREQLEADWKTQVASPVAAASTGEIDDIISTDELRARIASALLMLTAKGTAPLGRL